MMTDKKEHIKAFVQNYLNDFLLEAERKDNLDFFRIEINNHNGTIQIDHKFRSRGKVY